MTQESGTEEFVDACAVGDLRDDHGIARKLGGKRLLICSSGGRIYAIPNRCPHAGMTLEGGRIRDGVIFCPVHGQRFDLSTGCPLDGLTDESLQVYQTRIAGDRVEVLIPQAPA